MISLVIPSRNNKKYITLAYESIRRYLGTEVEVILLDDASTDGTWEWMTDRARLEPNTKAYRNEGPERVGHTVLYDIGADMASNEVFGIFHADMVASPNYIKNTIKHLKKGRVVSGTRIEPPLHPPGPEKFVFDLGWEPENFKEKDFLDFVKAHEDFDKERFTQGIFAPWIMYVEDFKKIGGHDKRVFAPMELEDSDLFNRFLLKGYELIQSRDAFVYHMTCRGSRFKDGVKIIQEIPVGAGQVWKRSQDSDEYTRLRQIKFREWWRKWHMDVLHTSNMLPIIHPRYDTGFIVHNCSPQLLAFLEPWCDTIYTDTEVVEIDTYIAAEQCISKFDIRRRIKKIDEDKLNDVLIEFDGSQFNQNHMNLIKQLPLMIQDSGEIGIMEFDIFKFDIRRINSIEGRLINADNPWYINQLL
jgi:glycosyltransferase involved in cell wall biosynthesis